MSTSNELGEFLRAKRDAAAIDPALPDAGARRRVAGLRRAEVALLAGISVEYYVKLEQGRERHPSRQVVDTLAVALHLDAQEHAHLRRLAERDPRDVARAPQAPVAPSLRRLLDSWPHHPALILAPSLDVLARNAMADALHRQLGRRDNLAMTTFLDPAARTFYVDHDRACRSVVANLRNAQGRFPADERIAEVIDELRLRSNDFARLWSTRSVHRKTRDSKMFWHVDVGAIELGFENFDLPGDSGQELVVYQAQPGSAGADALALLGSLHSSLS